MTERQITTAAKPETTDTTPPALSMETIPDPTTNDKQAEYFAAYRQQLRRMACPGCGDGEPNY